MSTEFLLQPKRRTSSENDLSQFVDHVKKSHLRNRDDIAYDSTYIHTKRSNTHPQNAA